MNEIEKALEALEDLDDYARMEVGVAASGAYNTLKTFIEAQAKYQGEWISVADRLPEPDVDVFVWPRTLHAISHIKPCGDWFFEAFGKPTHWQPLPPAPKEG